MGEVIPIEHAATLRARNLSRSGADGCFVELARAGVGTRVFIAERGWQRGARVWRIRVDGTVDVVDYFDAGAHREAFAALAAQDPATVEAWFSGSVAE